MDGSMGTSQRTVLQGVHLAARPPAPQKGTGTAMDKLRLVLVYLLTAEALPSEDTLRPVEDALRAPPPPPCPPSPNYFHCSGLCGCPASPSVNMAAPCGAAAAGPR